MPFGELGRLLQAINRIPKRRIGIGEMANSSLMRKMFNSGELKIYYGGIQNEIHRNAHDDVATVCKILSESTYRSI